MYSSYSMFTERSQPGTNILMITTFGRVIHHTPCNRIISLSRAGVEISMICSSLQTFPLCNVLCLSSAWTPKVLRFSIKYKYPNRVSYHYVTLDYLKDFKMPTEFLKTKFLHKVFYTIPEKHTIIFSMVPHDALLLLCLLKKLVVWSKTTYNCQIFKYAMFLLSST